MLSRFWLFVILWTVAWQAPLSVGFSRQEHWNGYPIPSPGNLPNPGIEPGFLALQMDSLPADLPGKPLLCLSMDEWLNKCGISILYNPTQQSKGTDYWYEQYPSGISRELCYVKKKKSKLLHVFLKWQHKRNGEKISSCQNIKEGVKTGEKWVWL